MSHPFFDKHRATLDRAVQAIGERSYWSPFPESPSPKNYGEGAVKMRRIFFRSTPRRYATLLRRAEPAVAGARAQ